MLGGAGIAKRLYVGGALTATTGSFSGAVTTGALSAIGGTTQHTIQSNSNTDVLKIQNLSTGGYASLVFNTPSLSAYFGVGGSGTGVYANNIYLTGSAGTSFMIQPTVTSVKIQNTTDASSVTTGCLQASGGAGFAGSVHSTGMASRFGRNVNNLTATAPVEIACDITFGTNQLGTGLRISHGRLGQRDPK